MVLSEGVIQQRDIMKKEMFFCIGAQKAGTTTLHDILKQNPDICLPKEKETHFFSIPKLNKRGLAYYFQECFDEKSRVQAHIMGEVDPSYCFFPGTFERIASQLSSDYKLKFIFVLRNPVHRAYSHYLMSLRRGHETLTFEDAVEKESERLDDFFGYVHFSYIKRGHYFEQVKELLNFFSEDQVLFLLFEEDLLQNTQETLSRIHRFLELRPFEYNYSLKSNPASQPRSTLIRDLIYGKSLLKNLLKAWVPSGELRRKLKSRTDKLNSKGMDKKKLSSELSGRIWHEHFEKDLVLLEKCIGKPLKYWKADL